MSIFDISWSVRALTVDSQSDVDELKGANPKSFYGLILDQRTTIKKFFSLQKITQIFCSVLPRLKSRMFPFLRLPS